MRWPSIFARSGTKLIDSPLLPWLRISVGLSGCDCRFATRDLGGPGSCLSRRAAARVAVAAGSAHLLPIVILVPIPVLTSETGYVVEHEPSRMHAALDETLQRLADFARWVPSGSDHQQRNSSESGDDRGIGHR